ncbi:sialic acid-binding Ig-like lectin 10 isoform X2 [Vicugna pacos]|uniref:Sialic acid-binding Ig-like lectin 10 isoform X2 n=1 Tax=Vicugna pacos TaxID=30538 RepID=A0ABM5DUU0_VICPA
MLLPLLLAVLWGGSGALYPKFQLQVPKSVSVQEGLCVVVSCSLITYPQRGWTHATPAHGYWFRNPANTDTDPPVATNKPGQKVQKDTQGRFQLLGNLSQSCSLLIRDVQMEDAASYFFRLERGSYVQYNFKENMFYLEVTVLTLTPRPQDHGTELTCRVDFSRKGVSTEKTVRLSVAYAPRDLVVSTSRANVSALEPWGNSPHLAVQKGQFLRLLCAADSLPLATLSWALEDRVLSWSHPSGSRTLELVLPGVKAEDAGRYTCQAENRLGAQSRSLDLSVQYAPENLRVVVSQANRTVLENFGNDTSLVVLEGQSLRLLCVTHSNPPARLSWARGGQTLSPSQPSDPGVLELPQIQTEHEGEFTCQAQNPLGSQYLSLSLSVVYPPQLLEPSCSWEDGGLHCSCSSRAQPAPSLRWRLGEGLLEGTLSNASFKVTSSSAGPWANSSLSLSEGLSSGLSLSCEAQNVHGAQSARVLLLPGEKKLISNGVFVAIGLMTLLFLCLIPIAVKTLRKKRTQAETLRSRLSRRSTILDYINVIPKPGLLAQKRKANPSSPSRPPPPDAHPPESRHKQKEPYYVSYSCPGPKASTQDAEYENNQEELHYAVLNFPGHRPWETQGSKDAHSDYAEIQLH